MGMAKKKKSQDAMKMTEIWDSTLYISGSQSVAQEPWGIPRLFQVVHRAKQ